MASVLDSGKIVGDRYRILYELGRGSWGRTYVAEAMDDTGDRFVLKEVIPPSDSLSSLPDIAEQLEQKTQVFHQLQHSQLPRFREVLRAAFGEQERLFLVRDYVEGLNYQELLQARRQQGRCFREVEVRELLLQVLPVLAYLHQQGIIHQNIAPDNLILRDRDRLPVPIDFGELKQAIASLDPEDAPGVRKGYAPSEQYPQDRLSPYRDLYALAVTALVLLTGREPHQLWQPNSTEWDWAQIPVSQGFEKILQQILAPQARERFLSASEVLSALKAYSAAAVPAIDVPDLQLPPYPPPPPLRHRLLKWGGKASLVLLLSVVAGTMGWLAGNAWIDSHVAPPPDPSPSTTPAIKPKLQNPPEALNFPPTGDLEPDPDENLPEVERQRQLALRDRRVQLGIDYEFFTALVSEQFEEQYPSQSGRQLSNGRADARWRDRRDKIASDLLDRLRFLSQEARLGLGRYTQTKRDRWLRAANALHVSSRAWYDLVDAQFLARFPKQEGQDILNRSIGQVWSAIALLELQELQSGAALEEITLTPGGGRDRQRGTLPPGTGKVFIANLNASQFLEVSLETDQAALFSVYSPTGNFTLLEDSQERRWSGELPESGFYEFVVVSQASEPLEYELTFAIASQGDRDAEF